jgi:hypothetical protein
MTTPNTDKTAAVETTAAKTTPAAGTTVAAKTSGATRTKRASSGYSAAATSTRPQASIANVQHLAERAILIPVGASLVVRDDIVSTVRGFATRYVTRTGIERELRRYERRGSVTRNRFERSLRRRRNRLERELRQRRNRMERAVRQNRRRVERDVRTVRKDLGKRSDIVSARVERLVSNAQELIGSIQ